MTKIRNQIVNEALTFLRENKSMVAEGGKYMSPRVSSEVADCSMPMTFDHFSYCSLGCSYCFAYVFKNNNPAIKEINYLKSVTPKKLLNDIQGKFKNERSRVFYKHFYSKKFLLHWGGLADPFCNFETKNQTGYDIIKGLGDLNYPALFSFKGSAIFKKKYLKVFDNYRKQKNFAFQVSIITGDEKLAKDIEIGVPSPSRRLKAIQLLSKMGYFTILRLRPYIIGVSDIDIDDLLHRALEAGINGVSMEFYAMDSRAQCGSKLRQKWIEELTGIENIEKYFKTLSPPERGGYMRLNRLVKERHVKKVYQFCMKHNLVFGSSDPDYKELCTSGSCCAMPDHYPANPLLENWSTNQLTYHVKELRKIYHTTGKIKRLHYQDVYGGAEFLNENYFAKDHVGIMVYNESQRRSQNLNTMLLKQWNNMRSPANPCNYLHGKILPVGRDSNGNLYYKYNPMPYEERWKEEGILLTK